MTIIGFVLQHVANGPLVGPLFAASTVLTRGISSPWPPTSTVLDCATWCAGVGRSPSDAEALRRDMRATDADNLSGSVDVRVGFDGLPRGSKIDVKLEGDIFKTVQLSRERPMATGSEVS